MEWKIEISLQQHIDDAVGLGIVQDIRDLGIENVEHVRTAQLYWLAGDITNIELETICASLLADAVTQKYTYDGSSANNDVSNAWIVEVKFKPGVTDSVGDSVIKGIRDLGIHGVESVRTGKKYVITGALSTEQIETISRRLLANDVIQNFTVL